MAPALMWLPSLPPSKVRIHCNLNSNYCSACENNELVASSATAQFKFRRAAGRIPLLLLTLVVVWIWNVDAASVVVAPPRKENDG